MIITNPRSDDAVRSVAGLFLLFITALALWAPPLHLLSPQWSIYENYRYGWAVPFLTAYLVLRRWAERPIPSRRNPGVASAMILGFGILLLPLTVLQEANPLWRLASFALMGSAVAVSLSLIYELGGSAWAKYFGFPLCFLITAVPWPTPVEAAATTFFGGLNAVVVTALMHVAGIPAVAHGNIIEVSTGLVGINEACSGIRSLQTAFVIQLFFGEFFRLKTVQRMIVVATGVGVAVVLNWCRTAILVGIAAHSSPAAMERWHDPTGVAVLLGAFVLCWWIAARVARRQNVEPRSALAAPLSLTGKERAILTGARSLKLGTIVIAASLLSVVGSELWFRAHEKVWPREEGFKFLMPVKELGFRGLAISPDVKTQLLYDHGESARWSNSDGTKWQLFHFRWEPGQTLKDRVRVHLAKSHRPEICLPASGRRLDREFEPTLVKIAGINFLFRTYRFKANDNAVYVFYAVREDGTPDGAAGNMRESHRRRLEAAWNGSRGLGQRVIEVAISSSPSFEKAKEAFALEMPKLFTGVSSD